MTLFVPFFQRRESVSDGQAEADCHQWQIGAGHLAQEVEEDFRPALMPPGRNRATSPDTLNISPTWHLTSPHVSGLFQYLSSIKGIHCVFHHINAFYVSHCRASPAQTQATTQRGCTGILCLSKRRSFESPQFEKLTFKENLYLKKISLLCFLLRLHSKSHYVL